MSGEAKNHVLPHVLPQAPPQLSLENTGGMSGVASVVKTRPVMTELIAPLMRFVMVVMSGRPPSIAGPGVARPGDGDVVHLANIGQDFVSRIEGELVCLCLDRGDIGRWDRIGDVVAKPCVEIGKR